MKSLVNLVKLLLLTVLSSYSLTVLTQQQPADYQLFRQDGTYFYNETEGWSYSVPAVKLDSSSQTSEGTEWFSHESIWQVWIEPEFYPCYKPHGPSWIGWKLLVKPDGENILFGRNHNDLENVIEDTIIIKTKALTGDSWCYIRAASPLGPDTMATVTRCDTMTFLGITDSVKVISLGNDSIILSKNFGLVRALNFRDFLPGSYYEKYSLSGITSNDNVIGTHLLTWREIYDFEAGDIFHRSRHVDGWPAATMYYVYQVLDKVLSGDEDTVSYEISVISWWVGPEGTSDPEYDTLTETYYDLDKYVAGGYLPFETIWDQDWGAYYEKGMYRNEDYYNGRPMLYGPSEIYMEPTEPDTCFPSMGTYSRNSYIEGCGDLFSELNENYQCMPCEWLDYFKKGAEEWGTPYTIPVGIGEDETVPVIKIFPNPVNDQLNLDFNNNDKLYSELSIYSIEGKMLFKKDIAGLKEGKITLDFSGFPAGIYFLKILGLTKYESFKVVKL